MSVLKSVLGKLDYETKEKYVLKVTAFNPNAADKDSFISTVTVIIDVEDANDPPAFIQFRQDTIPKEGEQVTDLVVCQSLNFTTLCRHFRSLC